MKDKLAPSKKAAKLKNPFIPCGSVVAGGMFRPGGSECHGGLRIYQAMHNGRLERFARDCECLCEWKRQKTEFLQSA
jgi:hypothetical protein